MHYDFQHELIRLNAQRDFDLFEQMTVDEQDLVKVCIGGRSCLIAADGFYAMLQGLPDSAGSASIVEHLEVSATHAERWATH